MKDDKKFIQDKIRAANNEAVKSQYGLYSKTIRSPAYRAITYADYVKFVELMEQASARLSHLDYRVSVMQDPTSNNSMPLDFDLASIRTQFERLEEELQKIAKLIGGKNGSDQA